MATTSIDTQERIKMTHRTAFIDVLNKVVDIQSTMGQSKALDYGQCTGGQNAQYNVNDGFFKLIDYTVDAIQAAKDILDPTDWRVFLSKYLELRLTGEMDLTIQTSQFLSIQERVGQVFIDRDLFPSSKYFGV